MTFKLNIKPESSATYVTREGLIPGVFLYMYVNIVDLEESLITYSAHELFIRVFWVIDMCSLMLDFVLELFPRTADWCYIRI